MVLIFYLCDGFKMPFDIYTIELWIDDDKRCNRVQFNSFSVCDIFYCLLFLHLLLGSILDYSIKLETTSWRFFPSLTE